MTIEERFWAKVDKTDNCWLWTGSVNNRGYGRIGSGGKNGSALYAHRVSYLIHFGEFDESLFVCHTCDVPNCVNPNHLFLGSAKTNSEDMVSKGRHLNGWGQRTHCINGHEFTDENTRVYVRGWRQCRECKNARRRKGYADVRVS